MPHTAATPPLPPCPRPALAGLLAAAALVMAAPGSARAGVAAEVVVDQLQIQLVDLDPADGVAPQASWADGMTLLRGGIDGLPGGSSGPGFSLAQPQAFAPLDQFRQMAGARIGGTVGPVLLSAWGEAGDGLRFDVGASTGHGLLGGGLLLGPGTGLRLTLAYALSAHVDSRDSACTDCELARAELTVLLGDQAVPLAVQADAALALWEAGDSGLLDLAWRNTGSQAQPVMLGLLLSATGQGFTAGPVPEPGAAWLLAAGLAAGTAAAGLRRRRQRPQGR